MSAPPGKPGDPPARGAPATFERAARPSSSPKPPPADATSQLAPVAESARHFGKYRLLAELGRGGMADVHLGVAVGPAGFSKLQVIKRLRPGMTDEAEMRGMMLDEARLAARLNHKNIVQTNEVGIVDDQYFLSMEYLDGQPYHRILKRVAQLGRTIPLPFAVKILCEVLSGLHYAHEVKDYDGHPLGVVHRDVSPQNIFVTYDGQVKVVDFGIAKAARRLVETQTGIIRGKLTYMAPEQAFASEIDRRADLFSVGVLLWEAIAGERLWGQLSDPEIVHRMMSEIPSVTTVKPDAPADLVDLCTRALSRDPAQRPATAAEMRGELEGYLADHDIQVNAEALGAMVVDLFAEERDELQNLVDRELAILRVEDHLEISDITPSPKRLTAPSVVRRNVVPGSSGIPGAPGIPVQRIPGGHRVPTPRAIGTSPSRAAPDAIPPPPDSTGGPTIPRAPAFDAEEGMTARELSPPVAVLTNLPGPPSSKTLVTAPAWGVRSRWRHPLVYVGAISFAAVAAVIVARAMFTTGGEHLGHDGQPLPSGSAPVPANTTPSATATLAGPSTAAAPSAPAAAPSATSSEDNFLHLRITTNPVETRILLDGAPLPPTPGQNPIKFPKDGAIHRVTVEASGFYPQSRMVLFDRDQHLDFILHSKKGGLPPPKDSPYR